MTKPARILGAGFYSKRKARMGSMAVARRAGRQPDSTATSATPRVATIIVEMSVGLTPNNWSSTSGSVQAQQCTDSKAQVGQEGGHRPIYCGAGKKLRD